MAISTMTRLVFRTQGESHSPITVPRLVIHPTVHLFFCFIGDMEDCLASRSASDHRRKSCAGNVVAYFERNLALVKYAESYSSRSFLTKMNFIARWTNLGFIEEAVICNHIFSHLSLIQNYMTTRHTHLSYCSNWRVQHSGPMVIPLWSTIAFSFSRVITPIVKRKGKWHRCTRPTS